ncbi:MAG: S41 family peptidase [Elusimicrobiales bacterium]
MPPETARRLAAARDIAAVLLFCAAVWLGGSAVLNSPYLQKERLTRREAAADIDAFFTRIDKAHPLPRAGLAPERWEGLKRTAHEEADSRLDEFGRITVRDLAYILYKAGAGLGDANTRPLWRPRRKWKDPELKYPPFSVDYRLGRFVIDAAADGELPGAELTAIDGTPFEAFIAPLLERVSAGDERYRRASYCADQGFWWDISGLLEGKQDLQARFRTPEGKVLTKETPFISAWEFRRLAGTQDYARPRVVVSRGVAWVDLPGASFNRAWRKACDAVFAQLRRQRVGALVLDLRRNAGTDPRAASYLLAYLAAGAGSPAREQDEIFEGQTKLLIGPGTANAAALLAARLRALGAVELLGEESGGPRDAYHPPETFTLPHSGIKFSVSSRRPPEPAALAVPDVILTPELLRSHKGDARAFMLERLAREKERGARTGK